MVYRVRVLAPEPRNKAESCRIASPGPNTGPQHPRPVRHPRGLRRVRRDSRGARTADLGRGRRGGRVNRRPSMATVAALLALSFALSSVGLVSGAVEPAPPEPRRRRAPTTPDPKPTFGEHALHGPVRDELADMGVTFRGQPVSAPRPIAMTASKAVAAPHFFAGDGARRYSIIRRGKRCRNVGDRFTGLCLDCAGRRN